MYSQFVLAVTERLSHEGSIAVKLKTNEWHQALFELNGGFVVVVVFAYIL